MEYLMFGVPTLLSENNRLKVIHSLKKLFCYVAHICNLVQEFNGLVSKRVDHQISPFYFVKIQRNFQIGFSSFL
jgi:hypothetical protein